MRIQAIFVTIFVVRLHYVTGEAIDTLPNNQYFSNLNTKLFIKKLVYAEKLSADYITKHCNEQGRFSYIVPCLVPALFKARLHSKKTQKIRAKNYNLIRHAGTIYSLCMYYEFHKDRNIIPTIKSSVSYLKTAIKPINGNSELIALWSISSANGKKFSAKLGGTALALLAFVRTNKILPGVVSDKDLIRLGNFLIYMQKPNGDFFHRFISFSTDIKNFTDIGYRTAIPPCLYYPGEAILALTELHLYLKQKQKAEGKYLCAALKALRYLALKRKNAKRVPADHWTLLASAKLNEIGKLSKICKYQVKQICISIINDIPIKQKQYKQKAFFTKKPAICPTAIRIEGLCAALTCISKSDFLYDEILRRTSKAVMWLMKTQITSGENKGGFPKFYYPGKYSYIRIDYVQHSLSALLDFHKILISSNTTALKK